MEHLYQKLSVYDEEDIYPFHMPGHKRNPALMAGFLPYRQDITEITGFDDLHHPEGIIQAAADRAAALFGVRKSFLGINGSTGMILSAILSCTRRGDKILIARNSHRSVYHALYLKDLRPVYLVPSGIPGMEVNGSIDPADVEKALAQDPDIKTVLITSPTYDGVVSDIRRIAEIVHRAGAVLIVDEAHGAHFVFSEYFPTSAVRCGADIVIHSIHKTLASLTQTALLHVCTDRVDPDGIQRQLSVFQTSSPSYILMASLDWCMDLLSQKGAGIFPDYVSLLEQTRKRLSETDSLVLVDPHERWPEQVYAFDRSKLLISCGQTEMSGPVLFDRLCRDYRLQLEMAVPSYVLALTSIGDTPEGMDRLAAAIQELDKTVPRKAAEEDRTAGISFELPEQVLSIAEAMDSPAGSVPVLESEGRVSAEFVVPYPPGTPLLVPGERITGQFLQNMRRYIQKDIKLVGLKDMDCRSIDVID